MFIFSTEISLELYLTPSSDLKYSLSLHDPQFYWHSYNGLTIPQAATILEGGSNFLVVAASQYQELDRDGARCQEDASYSFTACVRVRPEPGPLLLTDCHSVDRTQQDNWLPDPLGHLD